MDFAAACLDHRRTRLSLHHQQALLSRVSAARIAWRRLPNHLLFFVLRDDLRIATMDGEWRLDPGDAAWIPAGTEHALGGGAGRTLYRVRIAIDGITAAAPVRIRRQAWELQPLFALLQAASPAPDPVRLRALTALILSGLADPARPPAATPGLTAAQRAAVTARVSLWRTQGFPTPADLARAAGLGGDWFARSFRRSHGTSPRVWLGQERIRLAQADLLAGDVPAAAVARRLGYRHYAQFARAFRAATGMAPEAWRDRRGVPRQRQLQRK